MTPYARLASEFEALDAARTAGPWYTHVAASDKMGVYDEAHGWEIAAFSAPDSDLNDETRADARFVAWCGTHAAEILAALKIAAEREGLCAS